MKTTGLVHKGELDSCSKQKEELRPALSSVQSDHHICVLPPKEFCWNSRAGKSTPCRRGQPAHHGQPLRRVTLALWLLETGSSCPDSIRWQRKQKLCRLQALGRVSAGDRREFEVSGAEMMGTWKPRHRDLKGTPQGRLGSLRHRSFSCVDLTSA